PETGANADTANSGATLVYLSPGATVLLTDKWQLYGFVQLPIYQRVNGLQLETKTSFSLGTRVAF
ncbi:MAG TPA: TonB-dependent receptor, partial [Methylibium sp.]